MSDIRQIFENDYCGIENFLTQVLSPIFGEYEKGYDILTSDKEVKEKARQANILEIRHAAAFDFFGSGLKVFDITVGDEKKLENNKVGIQNIVRQYIAQFEGALIIFHHKNVENQEWRLSYVEKRTNAKDSTPAKRYTYILGKNHPAKTITDRFTYLAEKTKKTSLIIQDLTDAFSVEALSKEFFDRYREFYADLVEYISGIRYVKKGGTFVEEKTENANSAYKAVFNGDGKLVRDYVKKMMGRLVFLHFLQKKGWLGVLKGEEWGTGDKNFFSNLFTNADEETQNDFLAQALEPLFFNTLNSDRGKEAVAPKVLCNIYGREIRIPYLNGGLFEEDELDKKKVKFKKEQFASLFEFFNQYNFTIDETDPDDTEIGVDPEMLGKIFENLLEDNKDKGAFYTPKEIVQYMCRESLIAYLATETETGEQEIRDFVLIRDSSKLAESQKADILHSLLNVKVCDPAVGSGAFPMGMLNELFACTRAITGNAKTNVELKQHIVKNNIYGVDIEKGAVDIARLRFWLAIVVDETEPNPLPNLDYKIMQGNSLLESFEGIDLSNLCSSQKDSLFDDANDIETLLQYLETYFDRHEEKNAIRDAIKATVMDLLKKRGISGTQYDELENIDLHENNKFFLWHTWFNDVFSRPQKQGGARQGFDIVIGNPPYINVQLMSDAEKNLYRLFFDTFFKRCDIFCLFVELALKKLSSEKGCVSFIIPSVVHSNMSYQRLRDLILNNKWLREVCYTGGDVFNAPTVDTTILLCSKKQNEHIILKNAVDFNNQKSHSVQSDYFSLYNNVISIGEEDSNEIYKKLFNETFPTVDNNFTVYQGIVTGNNPVFIFENEGDATEKGIEKELLHPLCHGRDIGKYEVRSRERKILYIDNSIDINKYSGAKKWLLNFKEALSNRREAKKGTIQWCGLQWPRAKSELDIKEKILIQNTRNESLKTRIIATLDDTGIYGSQGINFVISKNSECNLRFLLAVLNSRLLNYLFATKFLNLAIKAEYVKQVRIPTATQEQQKLIIALVDKILSAKKQNPAAGTTAQEQEIDKLVYQLYGLTDKEIATVEGK